MLQNSFKRMEKLDHEPSKALLRKALHVSAIHQVNNHLDWYLLNGLIGEQAGKVLPSEIGATIKDFVPHLNTAVEALGTFKIDQAHGTVARDYVAYNA